MVVIISAPPPPADAGMRGAFMEWMASAMPTPRTANTMTRPARICFMTGSARPSMARRASERGGEMIARHHVRLADDDGRLCGTGLERPRLRDAEAVARARRRKGDAELEAACLPGLDRHPQARDPRR